MCKPFKPLFKYPGGKSSEYKHLKKLFPVFDVFVEPFVGGGAVYWATDVNKMIINDYSEELISIYRYCQTQDSKFITNIIDIGEIWEKKSLVIQSVFNLLFHENDGVKLKPTKTIAKELLSPAKNLNNDYEKLGFFLDESISRKKKSLAKISKTSVVSNLEENALGVVGAAIYTYLRDIYNETEFKDNPQLKTALYLFLREYSYSSMFRFNSNGKFNVPFGGNSYAKKSFLTRVKQVTDIKVIDKLSSTQILQGDFSEAFIDHEAAFMFLDPPYDSEFSTYNLQVFDAKEQVRLRNELLSIKKTKWLMVVKSTEFIEELYEQHGWYKTRFGKSYSVNFKNRNSRDVEHLIITNYELENA